MQTEIVVNFTVSFLKGLKRWLQRRRRRRRRSWGLLFNWKMTLIRLSLLLHVVAKDTTSDNIEKDGAIFISPPIVAHCHLSSVGGVASSEPWLCKITGCSCSVAPAALWQNRYYFSIADSWIKSNLAIQRLFFYISSTCRVFRKTTRKKV